MEWNFGKSTKKCAHCDKILTDEEFFFSALFWNETKRENECFLRQDYCSACWENKPDKVFSYWKTKISQRTQPKTSREVLMEFFDNLINSEPDKTSDIDEASRSKIIYLFSLVLLRRKLFKIKENIRKDNQPFLVFERIPDGKTYEVPELTISEADLVNLREQFTKLFEFEI